jgi:hypothetical protein
MGRKRMILLVATSLLAAVTILWFQGRFEADDEKQALNLVQGYQPPGGRSIPDVLAERHPNKPVEWSVATESACFQHIRVHAVVRPDGAPEPLVYAFVVDINGPAIHPGNEAGRELLGHLNEPPPRPSASVVPTSAPSSTGAP